MVNGCGLSTSSMLNEIASPLRSPQASVGETDTVYVPGIVVPQSIVIESEILLSLGVIKEDVEGISNQW